MDSTKSLYTALLCLVLTTAFSQHDNRWYFGYHAGLDFSTGTPVALTDGQTRTFEGSSVMCTPDGSLLFYTDGITVWNASHDILENGTELMGAKSSTQASLIFPKPGDEGNYYIFTSDQVVGPNGIRYSEVDMDMGAGTVTEKNELLLTPACEKLTAVPHANGTDVWVLAHLWGSNTFYAWLVSAEGVNEIPVTSNAGSVISGDLARSIGYLRASPDGQWLVACNTAFNAQLFSFDAATGVVSDAQTLISESTYGAEFSPAGALLYISSGTRIYQYRLDAPDISASQQMVADLGFNLGALQLAPDSKIYVSSYDVTSLSVINNPDVQGTGCGVEAETIFLSGKVAYWGLPNNLPSTMAVTAILSDGGCKGEAVAFSAVTSEAPDSYKWDFGDGTFSEEANPDHIFGEPGTYKIKVRVQKGMYARYFAKNILITDTPEAGELSDMFACNPGNGQAAFDLTLQDAILLGSQSPADFTVTYHTTLEDAQAGANALPGEYTNISNPEVIFARVTGLSGCHAETSFSLVVMAVPEIDMPESYILCSDEQLILTAPEGFESYVWSTGAETRSIVIDEPGIYTVTVLKDYGPVSCSGKHVMEVVGSSAPVIVDISLKEWTDHDNSITIVAAGNGDYEYSLDGVVWQDSPHFGGLESGRYTAYARDKNGCGESSEELQLLTYPKFFTPNGDGYNETWRIPFAYLEPDMIVTILDRYGKVLTSFQGNSYGWDGTCSGQKVVADDYWFTVVRKTRQEYKGHFSLVR